MSNDLHHKIGAGHLARLAYLYVRQSTLRQVVENAESTKRQYALRERAVALGWPLERVVVVDRDQGQSGADGDRAGFQALVAAVGMARSASCSAWRCRAWRAARPTGTGCWRSAP